MFGHVSDSTDKRGELYMFWSISERPVLTALVAGRSAIELEQQHPSSQSQSSSPQRDPPGSRTISTTSIITKSSAHSGTNSGGLSGSTVSTTTTGATNTSALNDPIVARAMQILRGIFGQDSVVNGISSASITERKRIVPNVSLFARFAYMHLFLKRLSTQTSNLLFHRIAYCLSSC